MKPLIQPRSLWKTVVGLRPTRLQAKVRAHLPVLPVLRAQLSDTAQQVEEAVVQVCGSFRGMALRARESVSGASQLLGGEESGQAGASESMESLIEHSHVTILHLLERMERNSHLSLQAGQRMEEVESSMRKMVAALAEVDQIAFGNKLLALNAKVQAVHVGELGAGFGVVADQISNQAHRSAELTEQISASIKEVKEAVTAAAAELRETASADATMLAASRLEAEKTLAGLRNTHEQVRGSLESMAGRSAELAEEISNAVMALQFQDRVSQRIGHVIEALESMENALGSPDESSGRNHDQHDGLEHKQAISKLKDSYTMESERAILVAASLTETEPEDDGGDVELF